MELVREQHLAMAPMLNMLIKVLIKAPGFFCSHAMLVCNTDYQLCSMKPNTDLLFHSPRVSFPVILIYTAK